MGGRGGQQRQRLGGQLVAVHHHAVGLPCTKYLKVRKIFSEKNSIGIAYNMKLLLEKVKRNYFKGKKNICCEKKNILLHVAVTNEAAPGPPLMRERGPGESGRGRDTAPG